MRKKAKHARTALAALALACLAACGGELLVLQWQKIEASHFNKRTGNALPASGQVPSQEYGLRLNFTQGELTTLRSGNMPVGQRSMFNDRVTQINVYSLQTFNGQPAGQPLNRFFVASLDQLRTAPLPLDTLIKYQAPNITEQLVLALPDTLRVSGNFRFVVEVQLRPLRSLRDTSEQVQLLR